MKGYKKYLRLVVFGFLCLYFFQYRNTCEEPSYFEALRRNQLQDQSEKNRYQCLTVFPEINDSG